MPRLPAGFYVVEVDFSKPHEVLGFLERVVGSGFRRIGLALEPFVVDVYTGGERVALALGTLSVILEPGNVVGVNENLYVVVKDTWVNYAWVDPVVLAAALRSILECENFKSSTLEIVMEGSCSTCSEMVPVENFALRYPYLTCRVHASTSINVENVRKVVSDALRENKVVTVVRVRGEVVEPVVWVELVDSVKRVHTCCLDHVEEDCSPVTQSIVDLVVSTTSEKFPLRGSWVIPLE